MDINDLESFLFCIVDSLLGSRPHIVCIVIDSHHISGLGQKAMRPETILKVCDALNISTEYLLRGVITETDSSLLMEKISTLTPKQYRHFEDILDSFIAAIQEEA